MYEVLASSEALIQEELIKAEVAQADETGMWVGGKNHWLHTVCNTLFTYMFVHAKRGKEALDSPQTILSKLSHYLIHDCWASYFKYKNVQHGLCMAHILRELLALEEQGSAWAKCFSRYFYTLYEMTQKQAGVLDTAQQVKAQGRFGYMPIP